VIKDLTERVVVNTGLVFQMSQSFSKLFKSIVCDCLLMYDFMSKSMGVCISPIRLEAI
jgi:hypothetical protein